MQKQEELIHRAQVHNPWFTQENSVSAIAAIAQSLDYAEDWLGSYPILLNRPQRPLTVGIIMAGNIPLVGFHDLLCTLITGNKALCKLSSSDNILMKHCIEQIKLRMPEYSPLIDIIETPMQNADAFIATGSNNSARYFEYYFRNTPSLIRKSRTSAAIIPPDYTDSELMLLGNDVFQYFGMGCRSVTCMYLPHNFDFNRLFKAWEGHSELINHHKYANNYTYHKAILLMDLAAHLDNGFVLLKERNVLEASVAMINYVYYTTEKEALEQLQAQQEQIQCISMRDPKGIKQGVVFGRTQSPALNDYADGIDTLAFLIELMQNNQTLTV